MTSLSPFAFEPFLRPMPWGGRRLANWVDAAFPKDMPVGEAWLLSDHALHTSRIAGGPFGSRTLRELMAERSEELIGYRAARFPLLIKLLDARENLSVQVHPDDAAARTLAPTEGGKTEAWLVLESEPDSAIYLGLKPGIDKPAFLRDLQAGNAPLCLRRYHPQPGECYFVPAGAVHALGGGLVVLEVQQTSDATFRLYDWGRVDAAGKPRALHIDAGLASLKEDPPMVGLQQPQPIAAGERLVDCDYFSLSRLTLDKPIDVPGPCILIGMEGEARVGADGAAVGLRRGTAIVVPAVLGNCRVEPAERCVFAHITIPPPTR